MLLGLGYGVSDTTKIPVPGSVIQKIVPEETCPYSRHGHGDTQKVMVENILEKIAQQKSNKLPKLNTIC